MNQDKASIRCLLLAAYFGPLPDFIPFWAKSCIPNRANFKWLLYTDQVSTRTELNPAVELIPYSLSQMRAELSALLGQPVPECTTRKVCDLRMLLYQLRKGPDRLGDWTHFGYVDVDMIYGNLLAALPDDLPRYTVVGAHPSRPTGPFTLIRADCADAMLAIPKLRNAMARAEYLNFDESPDLAAGLAAKGPAWLSADRLQPSRNGVLRKELCFGEWNQGVLTVSDGTRTEPAGFFHCGKLKGRRSFRIQREAVSCDQWVIDSDGIYSPAHPPTRLRLRRWLRTFVSRYERPKTH